MSLERRGSLWSSDNSGPRKETMKPSEFSTLLEKPLLFVQGKGGVGKTTVATAVARLLAARGKRTLLVAIEAPMRKPFEKTRLAGNLEFLNNESAAAFEEYAGLKIGAPKLVRIFLQNRLMRYLAKATPGIRELVLMGKIWYEMRNYDRIVVDMPATGHGLTMLQSLFNWRALFEGSPLAKDARAMTDTLGDPARTGHLVVSLPEEMPLQESLELCEHLLRIFPKSELALIANRVFPRVDVPGFSEDRPFSETAEEHAARRTRLETENMEAWRGLSRREVPFFAPPAQDAFSSIVSQVHAQLENPVGGDS